MDDQSAAARAGQGTVRASAPKAFGPYLLLHRTGAGGMGRVDVAFGWAGGMDRLCVLKRMHPELRTPDLVARFHREASVARGLRHPAIARTFGIEEVEGEAVILQEYVQGATIAQLEQRAAKHEPLPVALTVHIVAEVARALAYAHGFDSVGIVHRDIAPDNVMLSYDGTVKLIDFGIAKPVGDRSLTKIGTVVGRPLYSAPEVLAGDEPDKRADVYSLGVLLWQLLTGRIFEPGQGPPSATNRLVCDALDRICLQAVAPQVSARFQSASDLLDALTLLPVGAHSQQRVLSYFLAQYFDVPGERVLLEEDLKAARRQVRQRRSVAVTNQATLSAKSPIAPREGSRLIVGGVIASLLATATVARFVQTYIPRLLPQAAVVSGPVASTPTDLVADEAERLYRSGALDRAFTLAESLPGPVAHLIRGKVLVARQDFPGAATEFRAAARLSPDDPEPRRYLALLSQRERGGGR